MQQIPRRRLLEDVALRLQESPVVALLGARQVGKTTLARRVAERHENLGKRQIKAPKVYLRDSGVLHHFLGIGSLAGLRARPRYGASWEGFALEQTLMCRLAALSRPVHQHHRRVGQRRGKVRLHAGQMKS